jgi:hypothetical protein
MIRLVGPINSGVAAGGAGVATNNADSNNVIKGIVHAIHVKYNDTPPATTDVVIATKGTNAPAITLLTLTNKNTTGWFKPRYAVQDNLGVDIANEYDREAIHDIVNVSIAQANNDDSIDVYILLEE